MQISDILSVEGPDSFTRPIYAGNAIATVKTSDTKLVLTVRTTAFEKAAAEGGSGTIEAVAATGDAAKSRFVGADTPGDVRSLAAVGGDRNVFVPEHDTTDDVTALGLPVQRIVRAYEDHKVRTAQNQLSLSLESQPAEADPAEERQLEN